MPTEPTGRRPLKTREWPFFKNLAALLARAGATPNGISFASIIFGCSAGAALAATAHADGWVLRGCWLGAAVAIQLRLVANLLDGMVAVEGGKGGPTGDLWNEAPDRISDTAIFIGAGYAAGSVPALGWAAALVAVFVAYVRALGASAGAGQCFLGPQAKPHRMALMTVVCVLSAAFPFYPTLIGQQPLPALAVGLSIVILGGVLTAWRRLAFIAAFLREKSHP
jgi:phosphatidylglycerophosphate synthase